MEKKIYNNTNSNFRVLSESTLFHSKFVLNLIDKGKENREYNEENYFNLQDLVHIVSL